MVVAKGVDPLWAAQSYLRRRKYDECIEVCSQLLTVNPYDQVLCNSSILSRPVPQTVLQCVNPILL